MTNQIENSYIILEEYQRRLPPIDLIATVSNQTDLRDDIKGSRTIPGLFSDLNSLHLQIVV